MGLRRPAPLTPLVAHGLSSLYDGGPWLLRVPATLCAAGCVLVTALLARELGGSPRAQAWTAWGMTTTSAVLVFGHVFLTSSTEPVAICSGPTASWTALWPRLRHLD